MTCQQRRPKLHIQATKAEIQTVCCRYEHWKDLDTAWDELAQDLHQLTGARLAMTFQYDETENQLITKGVAGVPLTISRTMDILGMDILQRKWTLFDGVGENLQTGELILLDNVQEASSYNLSTYQSFYIQKMLGVEYIYSMGLVAKNGALLGNFVLMLRQTVDAEKHLYTMASCAAAEIERLGCLERMQHR